MSNWVKTMIFDDSNQAEKSILAFLSFFAAVYFGVTDNETVAEAFLIFSAATMGITALAGLKSK